MDFDKWPASDKDRVLRYLADSGYRSPRYRIFYVSTPKVACTTMKWWFAALEGKARTLRAITESAESDPDLIIHGHNFQAVAPEVTGLPADVLESVLRASDYFRFGLVRNPHKRIFSAWQSKMLLQEPLQVTPYLDMEFLHHPIETRAQVAAAFEAFLEHVASAEAPNFWDLHWTPQADLLRPDLIDYSKIIQLESPDEIQAQLNAWTGEHLVSPFIGKRRNESLIPYAKEFVTDRSVALIAQLYARDFELFGYDLKPPGGAENFTDAQFEVAVQAIKILRGRHQRIGERNAKVTALQSSLAALSEQAAVEQRQLEAARQSLAERDARLAQLVDHVVGQATQVTHLTKAEQEREARIAELERIASEREQTITHLEEVLAERDARLVRQEHLIAEHDQRIAEVKAALVERDEAIEREERRHEGEIQQQRQKLELVRQELQAVLNSRTWRMTAPIRRLTRGLKRHRQSRLYSLLGRAANFARRGNRAMRADLRLLKTSKLFDAEFYAAVNPDVAKTGMEPALHYLRFGGAELRDPSEAFSATAYIAQNPDVLTAGCNPLLHYLKHGKAEGRLLSSPEPFAAPARVRRVQTPEEREATVAAEVAAIRASGMFNETFYRSVYPDIDVLADPLRHYCESGWTEGRNPSDEFNTKFYLEKYPDIRLSAINPFWHYVVAGAEEGRFPQEPINAVFEEDLWFGQFRTELQMFAFYRAPNWAVLRGVQPAFKGHTPPSQPHSSLGYYDPADDAVLLQQARLARHHGLKGFCFELTEDTAPGRSVVDTFLRTPDIDLQFCVVVDCADLLRSATLDKRLAGACADSRYLRTGSKPLLLLDMAGQLGGSEDPCEAARAKLAEVGLAELFVIALVEDALACDDRNRCDAVMDHPQKSITAEIGSYIPVKKNGVDVVPYETAFQSAAGRIENSSAHLRPVYHAVTLSRDSSTWDHSHPFVYSRFQPRVFRNWLDTVMDYSRAHHPEDRRFIFLNAWNDWHNGLYVEPDRLWGFSRLNEVSRALLRQPSGRATPKVSVILTSYRHAPYLRRRLDSIYGQTYTNLEVILLDDCSPDESREILDEYAARYPEITRKMYNERNSGGVFRQWAKGIKAATGDLVWIAESDDYCDPHMVEKLVRCFDDPAVQLAYGHSVFVDKYEVPMVEDFAKYFSDLADAEKWTGNYIETAHNEVATALGYKNTIPNASGVLFRRPIEMPLLDDETWLSMRVAGDWVFYLHILRGGKIGFRSDAINYFRRYQGSTAELTYKKDTFYREVGYCSRTVAGLYDVPLPVLERCRDNYLTFYRAMIGDDIDQFNRWYDYSAVLAARRARTPNIMVSTMGFMPGGAEILPIRLANEFKRQGHSVVLFSADMYAAEAGVRRMLRNDVPLVETSSVTEMRAAIEAFGIEALNSHQWYVQKYPTKVPDVFEALGAHVASLHGMIEHGDAFKTTASQLRTADQNVSTWVYTAEKNLGPFKEFGLYDGSDRFIKIPNGLAPPPIVPVPRAQIGVPEDAFVLCCVSRAVPDKGWAEMVAAVERAREISDRDIHMVFVGNGPVYDEYCRIGVPTFVHLVGFSENSVGYYAAADMGIMLTKFRSESFPLTIVDCMFAGKPYIATDVGDIPNMLTENGGTAGALVRLDNWEVPIELAAKAIARFADDQKVYDDALALVPSVANRYRIEVVAQQYVEVFVRDIGRRKATAPPRPQPKAALKLAHEGAL